MHQSLYSVWILHYTNISVYFEIYREVSYISYIRFVNYTKLDIPFLSRPSKIFATNILTYSSYQVIKRFFVFGTSDPPKGLFNGQVVNVFLYKQISLRTKRLIERSVLMYLTLEGDKTSYFFKFILNLFIFFSSLSSVVCGSLKSTQL